MREFPTKEGRFRLRLMYDIKEIDDICLSALKQAKLLPAEPGPIKIDLFLEKYFDVSLLYEDLGEGVMGSTIFDSYGRVTGFTVAPWIEEEGTATAERRVRSTLAHEGGHGLLHPKLFMAEQTGSLFGSSFEKEKPKNFLCRSTDIVPGATGQPRYDGQWWEWQANRAIGGLLLPKPLVLKSVESLLESGAFGKTFSVENRTRAESEISEVFDVNLVVARIRLQEMFPLDGQKLL